MRVGMVLDWVAIVGNCLAKARIVLVHRTQTQVQQACSCALPAVGPAENVSIGLEYLKSIQEY